MDEDEYAAVTRKPLKLTTGKEKKYKNTLPPQLDETPDLVQSDSRVIITTSTKAEQAFQAKQDKIIEERVLKKASKTHKQRVEEFNKHLDSLSEHYDIPKVSWTK